MCYALLLISLFAWAPTEDDWTVPDNPDPTEILESASTDARAGKYKSALAKHIWYHENALEIEPAQYGVRLSFALSYWHDLAKKYKPAMKKLREVRDQAGEQVLEGENALAAFHDYESLNKQLREDKKTVALFKKLASEKPERAKAIVSLAMESLVAAKEYKMVADHVDFKQAAKQAKERYQQMKQAMPGEDISFLDGEMLMLLKVMTETDQQKLAKKIGDDFKKVNGDQKFHKKVDKLIGESSAL